MKERIIQAVLQQMLPHLNNEQMKLLQEALSHALYGVTLAETEKATNEGAFDALTAFVAAKRIEGCSEKTLRYYEKTIRDLLSTIGKPAQQVTTEDLRLYLTEYQTQRKACKVTIDNIRRILSSFFSWLEDEDYIVKSPARRIHTPSFPSARPSCARHRCRQKARRI